MANRARAGKAKRKTVKRTAPKRKATKRRAKAVPAGFQTVNAHIVQDDCARAIEFYKQAFGAKEPSACRAPGARSSTPRSGSGPRG